MRQVFLALLVSVGLLAGCSGGNQLSLNPGKAVAKYPIAVYKVSQNPQKEQWLATLSKCEKVVVLKDPTAPADMAYVQIAGGKKGYVASKHLAFDAAVLVRESSLFQRPILTSGKAANADAMKPGSVLFVEQITKENDQNWVKVSGTTQNRFFSGWVLMTADNIKKSDELLMTAIQWEELAPKVTETLSDENKALLEKIVNAPAPFSELAQSILKRFAGTAITQSSPVSGNQNQEMHEAY